MVTGLEVLPLIKVLGGKALMVKAGFLIKGLTATHYGPTALILAKQSLLAFQSLGIIAGAKAVVQMLIILGASATGGQAAYHAMKALRRWADADMKRGYKHARKALDLADDVAIVWKGKVPAPVRQG